MSAIAEDNNVTTNGFSCYVNDTMMPDGRPISAHCIMAVMCRTGHEGKDHVDPDANLTLLKTLVDPLTTEQAAELMSIDHWAGAVTLLDAAALVGHVPTLEYLILKGSDVNGQNIETRQTCLHLAAAGGHAVAVQFLIQKAGANPLARDRNGVTPFLIAAVAGDTPGHVDVLTYILSLRELGCPLTIDDCDGCEGKKTALGWARERGHTNVAAWLQQNGATAVHGSAADAAVAAATVVL